MSKAKHLLETLDVLLQTNEEYVQVVRNERGQFVDEEGNVYKEEDLVNVDEKKKKSLPPWLMKKGDKKDAMGSMKKKGGKK